MAEAGLRRQFRKLLWVKPPKVQILPFPLWFICVSVAREIVNLLGRVQLSYKPSIRHKDSLRIKLLVTITAYDEKIPIDDSQRQCTRGYYLLGIAKSGMDVFPTFSFLSVISLMVGHLFDVQRE